jgi:hypothetical protein
VPAGQWDDELSTWPEDRRRVVRRRIAFATVCVVLITLIILTILFVGNDRKSSARVTTNEVSTSTLDTIGFATSLPVVATATSLSESTTTTTSSTTTTSTTQPGSQTTTTTTTTPPTPFQLNPRPRQTVFPTSPYQSTNPVGCVATDEPGFIFDTPNPGFLEITRKSDGFKAGGTVSPQGDFEISTTVGPRTDTYSGHIDQTHATGTYQETGVNPCTASTTDTTWRFA